MRISWTIVFMLSVPIAVLAQSRSLVSPGALDLIPVVEPDLAVAELLSGTMALQESVEGRPSVPILVIGGVAGGAIGTVAGGYLVALMASDDDGDDLDFLSGAVAGAAIGEGLLLPLGVHLASHQAGTYTFSALASLGLTAVGLLALEAVHYDPPGAPIVLVAIPVAQIATSIMIERATE